MEWERVKYIVICILIALNIGLFGLRYQQGQESILSGTQERAVFEVLSRHGITLYTDLDTTAEPMSRLRATVATYEKEALETVFFEGADTTVITGMEETTYVVEEQTLVISGLQGVYQNPTLPETEDVLSRSEALSAGEMVSNRLSGIFGNMQLQNIWQKGNVWGLEYVGVYGNQLVFSNEYIVYLTAEGIMEIDFSYAQINGVESEEKEIVFADEALVTFMRAWLELGEVEEVAIQKVNVGYYLPENTSLAEGTELYLEPHYCISTLEDNQKFFVNGYTCLMADMPELDLEELPEEEDLEQNELIAFLETKPTMEEANAYFGTEGVLVEREKEGTWYQYDIMEVVEEGEMPVDIQFVVFCNFLEEDMEYDLYEASEEPLVLPVEEAA